MICQSCGGVVGRDCFNPEECMWITQQMDMQAAVDRAMRERDEREWHRYAEREYGDHLQRQWEQHMIEIVCEETFSRIHARLDLSPAN